MRNQFKISTKTRMCYPRTNALKRAGTLLRPPNRPPKYKTWLQQPFAAFSGRFRRLRRERYTKPARAEYILARISAGDEGLAKELGL